MNLVLVLKLGGFKTRSPVTTGKLLILSELLLSRLKDGDSVCLLLVLCGFI